MLHTLTPDRALSIFGPMVTDSAIVSEWITEQLHPDGKYCCPHCREELVTERTRASWLNGGRVVCPSCKRFFTNRTNTILASSSLNPETIYLIAVLIALHVPRPVIASTLDISTACVRKYHEILTAQETTA